VPQLDVSHANAVSARAFAGLLSALWVPARLPPSVARPAPSLLSENLIRYRLVPDFALRRLQMVVQNLTTSATPCHATNLTTVSYDPETLSDD
jgi:hypothetical protein